MIANFLVIKLNTKLFWSNTPFVGYSSQNLYLNEEYSIYNYAHDYDGYLL
jgi:hypothetical protein